MTKKSRKNKEIKIRCTELVLRKLLAICAVSGRTKTSVIEDLISGEYDRDKRYETRYYADLEGRI